MRYELFMTLRYLRAKRRQAVLSVITLIATLGIAVGVWALIVVLAFQSGMERDIQRKILVGTAHINVMRTDEGALSDVQGIIKRVEQLPNIKAAAPTVYINVLMDEESAHNAILKAVDLSARSEANEVYKTIVQGKVSDLDDSTTEEAGIILGQDLAKDLNLQIGDSVTAIAPSGLLTPTGLIPRQKTFKVVGIFKSGLYEYDSTWGYISMSAAQSLLSNQRVAEVIQIQVDDIYKVKEIASNILKVLGPDFKTTDWQQLNQPVFAALNLQRLGFFVGIGLIILVASLNIITTLIMMVVEKNHDIAILMSMGATSRSILIIFILQGVIIGIAGLVVGSILGISVSWLTNAYHLIQLDPHIYSISYLPFHIRLLDLLLVTIVTLGISFVATIYPAWKASTVIPAEALRYE